MVGSAWHLSIIIRCQALYLAVSETQLMVGSAWHLSISGHDGKRFFAGLV
jgi:hypothetical protein